MVKTLPQLFGSERSFLKNNGGLHVGFMQVSASFFSQYITHDGTNLNINGRLNRGKQFSKNTVDTPVTSWLSFGATDPREVLRGQIDTGYIQLLAMYSQPGRNHRDLKITKKFIADPESSPGGPMCNNNQEI